MEKHKELTDIFNQYMDGKAGELKDINIPVTKAMRERLENFAGVFGTDVEEVAGFLLWSYLIDVERKAEAIKENIMPKN